MLMPEETNQLEKVLNLEAPLLVELPELAGDNNDKPTTSDSLTITNHTIISRLSDGNECEKKTNSEGHRESCDLNILSSELISTKRVYSKHDFGPIKQKELDEELKKNLTLLDQTVTVKLDARMSPILSKKRSNSTLTPDCVQLQSAECLEQSPLEPPVAVAASAKPSVPSSAPTVPPRTRPTRPPLPARPSIKAGVAGASVPRAEPGRELTRHRINVLTRQTAVSNQSEGLQDLLDLNSDPIDLPVTTALLDVAVISVPCEVPAKSLMAGASKSEVEEGVLLSQCKNVSMDSSVTSEFPADVCSDTDSRCSNFFSKAPCLYNIK